MRKLMCAAAISASILSAGEARAQVTVTPIYKFSGPDGAAPQAPLVFGTDGNLYGTTSVGGNGVANPAGTVFRLTSGGTLTTLVSFSFQVTGDTPYAGVVLGPDGNFYGVNRGTGVYDGNVFRLTPAGTLTVLHNFTGFFFGNDGAHPEGELVLGDDGNFYGTTNDDGAGGLGIAFSISPAGVYTNLGKVGASMHAGLTKGNDGNFYGATGSLGGLSPFIFRLTSAGSWTNLHTLSASDGTGTAFRLVRASDGNFYGTALSGGTYSLGTIFRVDSGGSFAVLHSFNSANEGYSPGAGLIEASDGNLYGTTGTGGAGGGGTIFRISKTGTFETLYSFSVFSAPGYFPHAALVQGPDGALYGTTFSGGRFAADGCTVGGGCGTVFRVDVPGLLPPTTPTLASRNAGDADGDGKTDVSWWRGSTGTWMTLSSSGGFSGAPTTHAWGQAGDVPVPGDYDGDGKMDAAVFRPASGTWFVKRSSDGQTLAVPWGTETDSPVPGDYDGDGKTDIAIYRGGVWFILKSSSGFTAAVSYTFGLGTDVPVPGDYDGDGKTDLAVYRRPFGRWYIATSRDGYATVRSYGFGSPTDTPVPADYDGDGITDLGVYRPVNGWWYIQKSSTSYTGVTATQFGGPSDVPVPADYDGDGKADLAVYRATAATWFIARTTTGTTLAVTSAGGNPTDIAVGNNAALYAIANAASDTRKIGDFDADRKIDPTVFRPSDGEWHSLKSSSAYTSETVAAPFGLVTGDVPVSGDYDGDGTTDVAVFRSGVWSIKLSSTGSVLTVPWGAMGDFPVPGDYEGDGKTDIGIYRPSSGVWYILKSSASFSLGAALIVSFGSNADIPVVADFDGDGRADLAIYNPATSHWQILSSSSGFAAGSLYSTTFGGGAGDDAQPADFDGDGRADFIVFRESTGTWYLQFSGTGYAGASFITWGQAGDVPVVGDYDADGKADLAVFRPSTSQWRILTSSSGYDPGSALIFSYGSAGDVPILRRLVTIP